MDKSTIDVAPNAALDDASEIDGIVDSINKAMDELASVIRKTIPNGVQTAWSQTLKDDWNKYYTSDVPEVMEEMGKSAKNLRTAVENAKEFSNKE